MRENEELEGLNGEVRKALIKRRFVPVEVTLEAKGSYKTFRLKLPQRVRKVVGFYGTVDSEKPSRLLDSYYLGVGNANNLASNESFIKNLPSGEITENYMVKNVFADVNEWVYYAHPERLDFSVYAINDGIGLRRAATVALTDKATGRKEDYAVWRSRNAGPDNLEIVIEYNEFSM